MTIVNCYEKLMMLWEVLANFEQIPTYKCEKCVCDLGDLLEKKRGRGEGASLSYGIGQGLV